MKFRTTYRLAGMFAAILLFFTGCSLDVETDEQAIIDVLNSSAYTDASHDRSYGSDDSTLTPGGDGPIGDDPQRVPFVRFRRYIPPGGVSRTIDIQIPAYPEYPDTTALATINTTISGELRTMYDTTGNPILIWRKPFTDRAVRRVYLTRHENRWRVRRLTPLAVSTENPAYNLALVEVKVHASSWPPDDTFRLPTADTLLAREDLPCFAPNDDVTVWLTTETDGDSCWAFLHHGRPQWPYRWRRAYLRLSRNQFRETWQIRAEGYEGPQVRPSGHDAIGWQSLWRDTTHQYISAAWGLPYIVCEPGENLPDD